MNHKLLYDDLINKIIPQKPVNKPALIGIDGIDGCGKTTFADAFQAYGQKKGIQIHRLSIDGFHNPKDHRYKQGELSPAGYYEDSFNYEFLKAKVFLPIQIMVSEHIKIPSSCFNFMANNHNEQEIIINKDDLILFDGVFLYRKEINDFWNFRIFIEADFETILNRVTTRKRDLEYFKTEDLLLTKYHKRYIPGQKIYLRTVSPELKADVIIDNNDYCNPYIKTKV